MLGPPGSGKTSVVERLRSFMDAETIETGPILKQRAQEESDIGQQIRHYLEKGELVPTGIVNDVIIRKLERTDAPWILFDGYPRQKNQIEPFFNIGERVKYELRAVLSLVLKRSVAFERITGRRVCPRCGAVYNIHDEPPSRPRVCDRCGGDLIQRKDDTPEVVNERMEEFERNTLPVIEFFEREYPERTYRLSAEKELSDTVESALSILKNKDQAK